MLSKLVSLIHDRRKMGHDCDGCSQDRRRPTLQEATERLNGSIKDFNETITLSGDKVKELIESAKHAKERR